MPIGKLLFNMSLPMMISMLVQALYNIVDSIFVAKLSENALTAVSLAFPLQTLLIAVATGTGVGMNALLSRSLGEHKFKEANKIGVNAAFLYFLSYLVFLILGFTVVKPFYASQIKGADAEIMEMGIEYLRTVMIFSFGLLAQIYFERLLTSTGKTLFSMTSQLCGAITNIILDPIFIFGLHMGVSGAAVATVISQMASCAFVLRTLFGKNMPVRITFGGYSWRLIRRVLTIGFTPFIIIAMDNVMIITMNAILQKYGGAERGDLLITCATIAQSFMLVVTMPLGGITSGTQAVLAYNFGAGKTDRVKNAQKYIFSLAAAYTTLLFVLARTIGGLFVRLFTADPVVAAEALRAIRIFTLAIIPLAFQYEIVDGFTGLGQVQVALPLSFFRKGAYFVSLFLLPAMFGAEAAFYAEPVSDILGPIASVIVYLTSMKKVLAKAGAN